MADPMIEASLSLLKRGKTEMYINFIAASVFMGTGGGLISSYPMVQGQVPWQFGVGWALLAVGIVMGVILRPVVWLVYYGFVHNKEE